jgi:hypothetical protein
LIPAVGRLLQALHEIPGADATTTVSRTGTPERAGLEFFIKTAKCIS